ncbi:NADH dehydrogenase [ubiquinone] 1 alpha subcomplex subunit 6 [Eurytemora carolleeae]|uniref:NADH dehydrogenase [ubiquinone] 1 alpha subcomplex subunit 6 n=1 Tax=Eurytemora carolleeae TaxID=1294199 RepID=UPI000C767AED|nr:NADH dehydrogenase [ubiquinone] 1 alpha subcomplex subunit 6 [Eurytemora carolleeae]|eukprot:XP_023327874.1 NADH dehydrogenase [ubiquinone] 1 alpha subcomplex subunit 6-like [Eurytemora affinis]
MAASKALNITRQVKPLVSTTPLDARVRVLSLYKAWYRHIPYMCKDFDIPPSVEDCRNVLRSSFKKNSHLKDIRVIDMLVIKGQQDLKEVAEHWKQPNHIMARWFSGENVKERPKDFISKFLAGHE